ncbi:MAG: membrane protein insertase YidC [Minisyncoccia bacterium]
MQQLFYLLFLKPLFNFLAFLCLVFNNNLGWAILILAIGIRFLIWAWYKKMFFSQKKLQAIQPKMQEIQKKYKDDPQTANKLVFELFKTEKVNPFGSFGYVIFQFSLFLGTYWSLINLIKDGWANHLYSFIPKITLNYRFFNILDLRQPSFTLSFIYFVLTLLTTLIVQKETSQNKFFLFFPFLILLLYKSFPSALLLFWLGLSLVGLIQEIYLRRKKMEIKQNK